MLVASVAATGCAEEPGAACARTAAPAPERPAYRGFRWACASAPPCAVSIGCAATGWQRTADGVLDAVAACLLGPCERRRDCVDEALASCAEDEAPASCAGDDARQ